MPIYSHSRLSSFEKCPLQYRFRYIDKIKRDTQGIEAFMGNRVHDVLERLYRDLLMAKRPTLEALVTRYHRLWEETYSDKVRIVKTEYTADHYRAVGERCVTQYYRHYEPFDQATTLGLEERVEIALDGAARYRLQGYIDRLARAAPGVYEIHDYKTSSSLPSDADLRRDRQLSLYQMAVQTRFPDAREIRLIWHYLAFDQRLESRRTEEDLQTQRRDAMRLIDTIEAARDYPPRESPLCRWCEYRDICPVQKHLVKIEALPADESLQEDGVRLVDRLAALVTQQRSTEKEIARVEEAILAYAEREGATTLRGTDHQARLAPTGSQGGRRVALSPFKPEQIGLFE
ncbi:MAG TPA: PD-(D/E)XK nuclease family protein [Candidatus Polarisedimenticolia bacterium]|nr:PD-(D/E)XK nuclease family protein [Candidatus Polarisedimenticolia bacterium]